MSYDKTAAIRQNRNQNNTKNLKEAINMYIQCLVIQDFQEKCLKNPKRCKSQKQRVF